MHWECVSVIERQLFKYLINRLGMKDVFDTYDTKNEGFIKASLLGDILRSIGFNPMDSDIQRVIKEVDPQSRQKRQIALLVHPYTFRLIFFRYRSIKIS